MKHLLDGTGKITRWPKKRAEKTDVIKYIHSKFQAGKVYTEKEVNEIVNNWHSFGDHALIRREMCAHHLMDRKNDGSEYWVIDNE